MASAPVNALLRGLLVLEAVNTHGPAGLSQLWRHTGLPKATTLRLLESLRQAGYLSFDADMQTYRVSLRALALSNNVSLEGQLLEIARPIMTRLRERLGWPSDLAVFQHDKMVIVDTNRKPGMLSTNRSIGSRIPLMASATGRAYLAHVPSDERERLLNVAALSNDPFEQLARDRPAAERVLALTHRRGYALSDQEFLPTNRGAAVAVMHGSRVVCVINLIALASLVGINEVRKRYVPMLLDAKAEIEAHLRGFLPPPAAERLRVVRHSASGKTRTYSRPKASA
ncbi:MAG: helix-turn-helix domain-containing protein [Burkholderiaceae bacterium]